MYREWMETHRIDRLERSDTDSPFGDMIEFRAKRGDTTALYFVHRDELLDARAPLMPLILEKLADALDYGRPPDYMQPRRI